ncbi:MAG: PhzF family phenazine biosynthesis protein [Filifactoraceae bacterium]
MIIKVFTMNSFAKKEGGGNPAAVVLEADGLSDDQMRQIAAIIGFSETVFITKSELADFKLRFFTPIEEVDLCGHGTIGAFYLMSKLGMVKLGNYSQETKAGILNVEIKENNIVMMDQANPTFYEFVDRQEIADSLNIKVKDIREDLFPQIVSTGLRDIIIPISDFKTLSRIVPDMTKVAEISKKYNTIGYHLFSLETLGGTAHCRNLAPLYGIKEESACGTANGALGSYLVYHKKISVEEAKNIVVEQGYIMDMPSEILVSLKVENDKITRVCVGGNAINIKEIEIEI